MKKKLGYGFLDPKIALVASGVWFLGSVIFVWLSGKSPDILRTTSSYLFTIFGAVFITAQVGYRYQQNVTRTASDIWNHLITGIFADQVRVIIRDWYTKRTVFAQQVRILHQYLEIIYKASQLKNLTVKALNEALNNYIRAVEISPLGVEIKVQTVYIEYFESALAFTHFKVRIAGKYYNEFGLEVHNRIEGL